MAINFSELPQTINPRFDHSAKPHRHPDNAGAPGMIIYRLHGARLSTDMFSDTRGYQTPVQPGETMVYLYFLLPAGNCLQGFAILHLFPMRL
jgi:hypothetical protein